MVVQPSGEDEVFEQFSFFVCRHGALAVAATAAMAGERRGAGRSIPSGGQDLSSFALKGKAILRAG